MSARGEFFKPVQGTPGKPETPGLAPDSAVLGYGSTGGGSIGATTHSYGSVKKTHTAGLRV